MCVHECARVCVRERKSGDCIQSQCDHDTTNKQGENRAYTINNVVVYVYIVPATYYTQLASESQTPYTHGVIARLGQILTM